MSVCLAFKRGQHGIHMFIGSEADLFAGENLHRLWELKMKCSEAEGIQKSDGSETASGTSKSSSSQKMFVLCEL